MPGVESVSAGLWLAVGGRHEAPRVHGVSHFLEHMLFKGTRQRTAKQLSQSVECVGGYLNAFTAEEMTCYFAKASARHLSIILNVLMDMLLNSTFPVEEINRERGVIIEEVRMYNDQPAQVATEQLSALLWPGHPLGRNLTGTQEGIAAIRRQDLVGHCRRNYHKGNLWIVVAGKTDLEQVKTYLRPWLKKLRTGRQPVVTPVRTPKTGPSVRVIHKVAEQTQLAVGFRGVSRHDSRRYALRLLSVMLGENMSSRLFQTMRERHGLVYEISSSIAHFTDAGQFAVTAGLESANFSKGFRLILETLRAAANRAPSSRELQRAKDYMLGQFYLGLESTSNRMLWVGESLIAHRRIWQPDQIAERVEAVTPQQVCEIAQAVLRPERCCVSVVSPNIERGQIDPILKAVW